MVLKEHSELQKTLVDRLVAVYQPEAIFLFGSQAWGTPGKDSDIDLYVILKSSDESKAERIRHGLWALIDLNISIDLLVVTEDEFAERKNHPSSLANKVLSLGIQLYAA